MALFREQFLSLKNGKTVCLRTLQPFEAAELLKFKIQVAGETPFLRTGPEGYAQRTTEQEESWISKTNTSSRDLLLVADGDGEFLGLIDLHAFADLKRQHRAQMGISVAKKNWNLGLGTAMLKTIIHFAEGLKQLEFLELSVMADNIVAHGLYEKIGFQEVSRLSSAYVCDGGRTDEIIMRLDLRSLTKGN